MARFDAEHVLASGTAMAALETLCAALRHAGAANTVPTATGEEVALHRLGLGLDVDRSAVIAAGITGDAVRALAGAGAIDVHDEVISPRFALYLDRDDVRQSVVLVPRDGGDDPSRVYFGRDTLLLGDLARRFGPGHGTAADLGTGAGAVALYLAGTYDLVVATDILVRTAACAAITMHLNPRPGGGAPATACVADVAAGLRPGVFDLVVSNPPWMPIHRQSSPRIFAEGGATGFELPRRFVVESAALLAPGGTAIVLGLDVTWSDDTRPLRALARGLRRLGYEVAVHPTEAATIWPDLEADLLLRFETMTAAQHVALLVHRP